MSTDNVTQSCPDVIYGQATSYTALHACNTTHLLGAWGQYCADIMEIMTQGVRPCAVRDLGQLPSRAVLACATYPSGFLVSSTPACYANVSTYSDHWKLKGYSRCQHSVLELLLLRAMVDMKESAVYIHHELSTLCAWPMRLLCMCELFMISFI